jgi:hypothetical protein
MKAESNTPEPSIVAALGHVVGASERVLIDRIELARLDAVDALTRTLADTVFLACGAALVLCGWLSLSAVAVLICLSFLPLPAGLAIVGASNMVLGAGLVGLARPRKSRGEVHRARKVDQGCSE